MRDLMNAVLDASILFSFDRSGFLRHARSFDPADLAGPRDGQVHLVTGGNAGLGRAAALGIARTGAEVWLLCRDRGRGIEARDALRRDSGNERVELAQVDLSRPESIAAFAAGFPRDRVDALIHNAGLLPGERIETPGGHELTFATHVLGPHLLTDLLRTRLCAARGRVVFVSSGGMYTRALSLDDVEWQRRDYDGVTAYAQTKRMQVVLSELWADELGTSGVVCHAMHPGWADTSGVQGSLPGFYRLMRDRLRTPEQGADTIVWLAVAERPARSTGQFWFDRAPARTHLLPWTRESSRSRRELWERCQTWVDRQRGHGELTS